MVRNDAKRLELSNDRVMRLDKERLQRRIRLGEMSVLEFWKKIVVPDGHGAPGHVMKLA